MQHLKPGKATQHIHYYFGMLLYPLALLPTSIKGQKTGTFSLSHLPSVPTNHPSIPSIKKHSCNHFIHFYLSVQVTYTGH